MLQLLKYQQLSNQPNSHASTVLSETEELTMNSPNWWQARL